MHETDSNQQVSRRAQIGLGVSLIAAGLAVIALAFGWIASPPGYMKAPRWVVGSAGAVFFLGGLLMLLPDDGKSKRGAFLGALMTSLFALVGTWVAFWPGERHFGGALAGAAGTIKISVGEYVGRAAFGIGAVILIAFAAWAWVRWLRILRTRLDRPGRGGVDEP
jgi:MFS family permease